LCEVFISIGTSALVEPAASLPYVAKGNGAFLVEINPEKTSLSDNADEVIQNNASKALTTLVMILDRLR
jgi:NAD-dependent deacetylase